MAQHRTASDMDCRHVEELLPGYALNALDAVEVAGVEEHLPACKSCTTESRSLLESVVLLSQAAVPATPPDHLRSRLLARVPSPPRREPERAGFFARRFSFSYAALGVALVAVVAVAAFAGVAIRIGSLEREIADANDRLDRLAGEHRSISYAMADPYSEVVALDVAHESLEANALLLVSHRDGVGVLIAFGLAALPHGDHYDVWLSADDSRHMMGSFRVDETGWGTVTIAPGKPLADFEHILVTPRPSEQAPSSDDAAPVLWGALDEG